MESNNEFSELRRRWKEELIGRNYDIGDEYIRAVILKVESEAQRCWDSMNKTINREFLWNNAADTEDSAHITTNYRNLEYMAKAYTMNGSTLKGNKKLLEDIISGMNWMYKNRYHENMVQYGNWWNWEIGAPIIINNIVVLLYNDFTKEQIKSYMDAIYYFQPDPTKSGLRDRVPSRVNREATGANRVDIAKVAAVRGAIIEDNKQINDARNALSNVFLYVNKHDGFYTDGSFIQHDTVPYTGTYGEVLLSGISILLDFLSGTSWQIIDPNVKNIYDSVENSFAPLIYKGAVMDMVCGRGISREDFGDHVYGHRIISSIIRMAQFAPEPYSLRFKGMAKYWINEDKYKSHFQVLTNIKSVIRARELLNDNNIIPMNEPVFYKNFANMDRVVHKRPGFAFTISMYSNRISNFEYMNGENKKAWHTADGMTYLYNSDLAQYSDGYWPTVDSYRIPGTTVDKLNRKEGEGWNLLSNKNWVGGTSIFGQYGIAGMELQGWNSTLTAKKSWFMFDDEIVCLGAGINSSDNRIVETIIENRKLEDLQSNKIYINGVQRAEELVCSQVIDDVNNIYLEGSTKGSSIGYYFPKQVPINILCEARKGSWKEVNEGGSSQSITRNYLTLWFNHGTNPKDQDYAYAILPNKTKEHVNSYAQNPDFSIMANNHKVQAIKKKGLNILAVNFWNDEKQTVENITCSAKASIMVSESREYIEVSISDPTMNNDCTIDIEINNEAILEEIKDPSIIIQQLSPVIKFGVNVKDAKGKSFFARFKKIV